MADDDQQDTQDQQDAAPETGDAQTEQPDPVAAAVAAATKKANKEAETLRLKLKAFEDRDKTETQRLTEERDALKAERDATRAEALRTRVALSKGLPADLVDRLRGDDEESMAQDADRLIALLKPGRPAGDIDQGIRPGGGGDDELDPAKLADAVVAQRGY